MRPPLIRMVWAVTHCDSGRQRNSTTGTTSVTWPKRLRGVALVKKSTDSLDSWPWKNGVSIGPGLDAQNISFRLFFLRHIFFFNNATHKHSRYNVHGDTARSCFLCCGSTKIFQRSFASCVGGIDYKKNPITGEISVHIEIRPRWHVGFDLKLIVLCYLHPVVTARRVVPIFTIRPLSSRIFKASCITKKGALAFTAKRRSYSSSEMSVKGFFNTSPALLMTICW